jgi:hypothetical protein
MPVGGSNKLGCRELADRICPRCAPGDLEIWHVAGQGRGRRASGPVGRVLCGHVSDQSKCTNTCSDLVTEISAVLNGSWQNSSRCAPDVPRLILL